MEIKRGFLECGANQILTAVFESFFFFQDRRTNYWVTFVGLYDEMKVMLLVLLFLQLKTLPRGSYLLDPG